MKVLIIGKIWPEPSSSAAGKRTLDVIESLDAAGWQIHFASAAQKSEYSVDLEQLRNISTHAIELNSSSFDDWVKGLEPDIVIFDRYMTEEQFGWRVAQSLPEALRVVDTSDLHFLREARHQSLKSGQKADPYNAIAIREVASIFRSDFSLIISEFEYEYLLTHFPVPSHLCAYWPFLFEKSAKPVPEFERRSGFAMIGSFLHEPNWDAARYCCSEIWPKIRERLPKAELHIYGSYPSSKVTQLHAPHEGINIMGRAKDALETLKSHRVNLAPLRFGAGLKGKLFDSILAGTPTAATPIAVEGVCGDLDWGSQITDDANVFAETAVHLYENKDQWITAQKCGYTIARQRFDKSIWLKELPKLLNESYLSIMKNRKLNFVGTMLNHHSHRSTEYMSRWIEAKNAQL